MEVAGSLWVRSLRSGVFTASASFSAMKNNCHTAPREREGWPGREGCRERRIRRTEKRRVEAERSAVHIRASLGRVFCDLCALPSWAMCSTGMMSSGRLMHFSFCPPKWEMIH